MKRVLTAGQYRASQASLCRILGLHRSTVSKMITRLIALRLLEGQEERGDGRLRMVCFTEHGFRLFREALQIIHGERELTRFFRTYVWRRGGSRRRRPRSRERWMVHAAVDFLFQTIKRVARALGDTASVLYFFRRNGVDDCQSTDQADRDRYLRDIQSGRFARSRQRAQSFAQSLALQQREESAPQQSSPQ